jgi:hypothetical protein
MSEHRDAMRPHPHHHHCLGVGIAMLINFSLAAWIVLGIGAATVLAQLVRLWKLGGWSGPGGT